jgi:hypothetical protein
MDDLSWAGEGMEQDRARFYSITQNGVQFKTYGSFISRIFPFNIFGLGMTTDNSACKKQNHR